MDTTLADFRFVFNIILSLSFSERSLERGDISFLFNATADKKHDQLIIMDNKAKVFVLVVFSNGNLRFFKESETKKPKQKLMKK